MIRKSCKKVCDFLDTRMAQSVALYGKVRQYLRIAANITLGVALHENFGVNTFWDLRGSELVSLFLMDIAIIMARDQYTSSTLIGGKRRSRSKFTTHYARGTNGGKVDVKTIWIPTCHWNGSCFTVTWIMFKNRILEVGLRQNRETMALRMLTTVGSFYFISLKTRMNI